MILSQTDLHHSSPRFQSDDDVAERPFGVSLLSVLHLVVGVLLLGVQVLLFPKLEEVGDSLRSVGLPPILLILGMMIIAALAIFSGIGMWRGTKWGWWLGAFYYVYSILRNASALFTISAIADEFGVDGENVGQYLVKHIGRIVISSLLLLYFLRENVVDYFGIDPAKKWKAVGILFGIGLGFGAVGTVLSLLMT